MISVITPSNRDLDGLKIIEKALRRQTHTDFEWIIGSPHKPELDINFKWIQDPPKSDGDYWVLNKLYNMLIKESSGELIVSIQDYTSINPDALSKFWYYKDYIVSGVGNKYSDKKFVSSVWKDPRIDDKASISVCDFSVIEGNFCSVPKSAIYEVGGFDEGLDKYAGMDWFSVLHRISLTGKYKFLLDMSNISYSIEHGRYDNWESNNALYIYTDYCKRYDINYKLGYI
jgi:hypothetical protein